MKTVSFLPAERLDELIEATGFHLQGVELEYKYGWLLERIGILRETAQIGAIIHDNPEIKQLVALIEHERRWSAAQSNTIRVLQAEVEKLRRELCKHQPSSLSTPSTS